MAKKSDGYKRPYTALLDKQMIKTTVWAALKEYQEISLKTYSEGMTFLLDSYAYVARNSPDQLTNCGKKGSRKKSSGVLDPAAYAVSYEKDSKADQIVAVHHALKSLTADEDFVDFCCRPPAPRCSYVGRGFQKLNPKIARFLTAFVATHNSGEGMRSLFSNIFGMDKKADFGAMIEDVSTALRLFDPNNDSKSLNLDPRGRSVLLKKLGVAATKKDIKARYGQGNSQKPGRDDFFVNFLCSDAPLTEFVVQKFVENCRDFIAKKKSLNELRACIDDETRDWFRNQFTVKYDPKNPLYLDWFCGVMDRVSGDFLSKASAKAGQFQVYKQRKAKLEDARQALNKLKEPAGFLAKIAVYRKDRLARSVESSRGLKDRNGDPVATPTEFYFSTRMAKDIDDYYRLSEVSDEAMKDIQGDVNFYDFLRGIGLPDLKYVKAFLTVEDARWQFETLKNVPTPVSREYFTPSHGGDSQPPGSLSTDARAIPAAEYNRRRRRHDRDNLISVSITALQKSGDGHEFKELKFTAYGKRLVQEILAPRTVGAARAFRNHSLAGGGLMKPYSDLPVSFSLKGDELLAIATLTGEKRKSSPVLAALDGEDSKVCAYDLGQRNAAAGVAATVSCVPFKGSRVVNIKKKGKDVHVAFGPPRIMNGPSDVLCGQPRQASEGEKKILSDWLAAVTELPAKDDRERSRHNNLIADVKKKIDSASTNSLDAKFAAMKLYRCLRGLSTPKEDFDRLRVLLRMFFGPQFDYDKKSAAGRLKLVANDRTRYQSGGLSFHRVQALRELYSITRSLLKFCENRKVGIHGLRHISEAVCSKWNLVRRERVRLIVNSIAKDVLAEGAGACVLENLKGFTASDRRTRLKNRGLMEWSHRKIVDNLVHALEPFGIDVVFVEAKFTSQMVPFSGRLDRWRRFREIAAEDFASGRKSYCEKIGRKIGSARKTGLKAASQAAYFLTFGQKPADIFEGMLKNAVNGVVQWPDATGPRFLTNERATHLKSSWEDTDVIAAQNLCLKGISYLGAYKKKA